MRATFRNEYGDMITIEGASLQEVSNQFAIEMPGMISCRVEVLDDRGFTVGWLTSATDWCAA